MQKLFIDIHQQDALEKQDFFQYQAGDNSLLITNYAENITAIRELGHDDFYTNCYYKLSDGETDKDAILAFIHSELEFVLGDPDEFNLLEVLKNIYNWVTY